jgi:hypothetical protein
MTMLAVLQLALFAASSRKLLPVTLARAANAHWCVFPVLAALLIFQYTKQ